MDAVDSEADGSDPMELLVVQRQGRRETFTRYRLQETLMLMGCRTRDAVAVTKDLFAVYHRYLGTASKSAIEASKHTTTTSGHANQDGKQSVNKSQTEGDDNNNGQVCAQDECSPALPWHYVHQSIYSSLNRLDYMRPHLLLDFSVAKEITQRNRSFVVLLGGTSGTGKSTLAALLAARLRLTTVLPTDSVRHILRAFTSKEENPCAFVSTYQAGDALPEDIVKELSTSDGAMSNHRLHKRKVLRGYKMQSEVVLEKLDQVLTMFERRQQSLVVEGVHLNTDQMMELVRRHPNCIPFVIYISNELKHRERFAVRARHMTIDPQENKYIKYFDNIRIIQRHLCKHADKFLIPKIDNTNVDRSIATIQSTLIRVLRKMDRGEKIYDERLNKMVLLSREHENAIKKAWSSKGVRKAMRPLIRQKVSKRLLLRRLLAEQSAGLFDTPHQLGDDSSSSEEERSRYDDAEDDDDEDDEQGTVVGSLFSSHACPAGSSTQPRNFHDELEEHNAVDGDSSKLMRSLSSAIKQAARWRVNRSISSPADWEILPPPRSPDITFSEVIESMQGTPGFAEMQQRWKSDERRRSWMAGDLSVHTLRGKPKSMELPPAPASTGGIGPRAIVPPETTAPSIPSNASGPRSHRAHFELQFQAVSPRASNASARRSKFNARRVQSLPPDAIDLSGIDYDIDSISVAGGREDEDDDDVDDDGSDQDRLSQSSSHRDECISPLEQSADDTDSHFEVSSHSSMEGGVEERQSLEGTNSTSSLQVQHV